MTAPTAAPVIIRPARIEEILALRHAVLRPGRPLATARFDGDGEPETRHYGAFERSEVVACASVMRRVWDGGPAWQIRGMATRPDRRRRGLGGRLLDWIESDLTGAGAPPLLWCNARVEAAPFYAKHGWQIASAPFDIPDVGPHVRMLKRIPS